MARLWASESRFRGMRDIPLLRQPIIDRLEPTFLEVIVHSQGNSEPRRMYLRRVSVRLWPVCAMMARSGTPAAAALVARPARKLWPEKLAAKARAVFSAYELAGPEAVVGVTLRGEQANEETVRAWLESFEGLAAKRPLPPSPRPPERRTATSWAWSPRHRR